MLPFRSVVSTSTGLAYAAISLLACVQLAAFLAGDSAWIALLVAGVLAVLPVLPAFCFSELNALYPSAAAIRQYIRAAFGERASLTIALGYMLAATLLTGVMTFNGGFATASRFLYAAALVPTPLPLVIAVVIFAVSFVYVRLEVPRLKAAAEAKRKAAGTRRPRRPSPQGASGVPTEAAAQIQE